jgi:hypothetical protein
MADVPLTEKRLLELLEPRFQAIDDRFQAIDDRFQAIDDRFQAIDDRFQSIDDRFQSIEDKLIRIDKRLIGVEGFQRHESDAIEFELRLVLEKFLRKEYPIYTVKPFPMKEINDPYTNTRITDFDAAYLIEPYRHDKNNIHARLKEKGITYTLKRQHNNLHYIFILAEAKHYIDTDKIKLKLWQFDKLIHLFSLANDIIKTNDKEKRKEFGVHSKFLSTVQYNQFLAHINEYKLFFGAAYWQKGLLTRFKNDVEKRNKLYNQFMIDSGNKKIKIYHDIIHLEKKWYHPNNLPNDPDISDEKILQLQDIKGAMKFVDFIQPSGERYNIVKTTGPVGITSISIEGGVVNRNM